MIFTPVYAPPHLVTLRSICAFFSGKKNEQTNNQKTRYLPSALAPPVQLYSYLFLHMFFVTAIPESWIRSEPETVSQTVGLSVVSV